MTVHRCQTPAQAAFGSCRLDPGSISRLSMSITRDLKNKAAKRGHIRLTALPVHRTTFRGKNCPAANHKPFRTTLQRDSVVKSALRVNSGTAGSRRRAFQIVNSLGTRAGLWLFSLRSRGGSHEEVGFRFCRDRCRGSDRSKRGRVGSSRWGPGHVSGPRFSSRTSGVCVWRT